MFPYFLQYNNTFVFVIGERLAIKALIINNKSNKHLGTTDNDRNQDRTSPIYVSEKSSSAQTKKRIVSEF